MKKQNFIRCAALLLTAILLLTACGTRATTIHLVRTEGEVGVSDDAGKDVALLENLGLYSGYGVDTRPVSFAWINLDDTKLTKLDESSKIAIVKEDRRLEIEVLSGSLFFNVTEPLQEDEVMEIRTATMLVGIRGTCGWVEVPDASHMNVYLLEGAVTCTAGETVTVSAGEVGRLDAAAGTVTVEPFARDSIPGFVRGELDGIPVDNIPDTLGPSLPADAAAQYRALIEQAASLDYGSIDPPTGVYRYALAGTRAGYDVPALLLEQETTFGLCNVLTFQYQPETGEVVRIEEALMEGVAQIGGYRGSLFIAGDGDGLLSETYYSGDGTGFTERVTVSGTAYRREEIDAAGIVAVEIAWYDIADPSGLDAWGAPSVILP